MPEPDAHTTNRAAPCRVNLKRYLERIHYTGSTRCQPATLHALTRAHSQAIPFTNAALLLGHAIDLAPAALYHKLVTAHDGGYCFEQNGLLLEMLRQIGFQVRPLGARVRLGTPDRSVLPQRTHMLLEVSIGDDVWITDVGVGGFSLTAALLLKPDTVQTTAHDQRRLQYAQGRWWHQVLVEDEWRDVYEFTRDPMPYIDRVVANWYTSTHPQSHFTQRLMVALAGADGTRLSLRDGAFKIRRHGQLATTQSVTDAATLRTILQQHFALDLSPQQAQRLWPFARAVAA